MLRYGMVELWEMGRGVECGLWTVGVAEQKQSVSLRRVKTCLSLCAVPLSRKGIYKKRHNTPITLYFGCLPAVRVLTTLT